ncbi:MAG: hypothetical protein HRT95_16165 [Moritella sp.]|uniref:murein biosynthesis integral membrane protein MurJ n=1 Tax=Moritella sp. TaxID=78556 RepID=UPI001D77319A|nr:lipid II flippase MurJ [Moritella sp.]NQZ51643.1 hypothetical protein [Moritella sp.]
MIKAMLISSIFINLGMVLGRLSGFFREAVLASNYGVSAEADIIVLLLSIPDLLVNILVGGGLAAALIPEFSNNKALSRILVFQALLLFTLMFGCIALGLVIKWELLLSILVPGFTDLQIQKSSAGMLLVLWLLPLTVASGVVTAYLHSYNRFIAASMGTLIINLFIIAGLYFAVYYEGSLTILGWAVLIGGTVRFLVQFLSASHISGFPQITFNPWLLNKDLVIRYMQVASAGSLLLCYPVIIRAFVSGNGDGSVSLLSYSLKLVALPVAIGVTFLSVVIFPRMARAKQTDIELFFNLAIWGLRLTVFFSLITTIAIKNLAPEIVDLVFGYGAMNIEAIHTVAKLLNIGVLGLLFMAVSTFTLSIYSACKDTKTPLIINFFSIIVLIIMLKLYGNSSIEMAMYCLVFAYGVSASLNILILICKFKKIRFGLASKQYLIPILIAPIILSQSIAVILPLYSNVLIRMGIVFLFTCICFIGVVLVVPNVRNRILKGKV